MATRCTELHLFAHSLVPSLSHELNIDHPPDCGFFLLAAGRRQVRLRPSNIDASAGSVKELQRIVGQIRQHWPAVRIVICAASGFCREAIMAWCQANDVDYVLGLVQNKRLVRARCDTIRLKLLKIGAQVRVTFRKVWVSLAECCPYHRIFQQVYANLVAVRSIPLRC